MADRIVGYEFLRDSLSLSAFAPEVATRAGGVTRKNTFGDRILAVPVHVAPASDDPLEHLLFALKHEQLNLQIAILALQKIPAEAVARAFIAKPTSWYARQACYLWELANGTTLTGLPAARGPYGVLFSPDKFLTAASTRSSRWRVDFNGIGSLRYCITVRRTPAIDILVRRSILDQVKAFVDGIDPALLDRAVRWAYLSETDNSYAIERESATNDKREAFASLLARAHEAEQLTEDYLVALQNLTITSPLDKAFEFRSKQNWLRKDLPGALGVTYLPPPPDLNLEIMDEIMSFANNPGTGVDALVRGAVTSFAFVFSHPFMDGNGRLSRFLFHKAACQDPRLANGLVLPVSVAMKRNEGDYLKALESFSKKTRHFWKVTVIDELVKAEFTGAPEIYRYWDGTECVEFGLRMAQEALDRDLQNESAFLQRFDQAYRAVNDAVDMNNDDLVLMIRSVLQNKGVLSNNRRKQLIAKGHPTAIIDKAIAVLTECLADDDEAPPAPVPRA